VSATVSADPSAGRPANTPSRIGPYDPVESAPWWARPGGIALIVGLWAILHALIAVVFESAINVDDAIESYLVQSFEISYVARNPPVFDWLLYGIQKITGPGALSFAILRYSLLFACAMLVYRVAVRAIADPRLQALAVFSLSALWVIGYHSHRILTHSNAMIVAIAGTMVTLIALRAAPSRWLYAALGGWIALGVLSKFGYVAFFAAILISCLLEPSFRRVWLDRRIAITLGVAAVPIILFSIVLVVMKQDVFFATADVIAANSKSRWSNVLDVFAGAWIGYLLPLIGIVALVFLPLNRGEGGRASTQERAAIRHLLRSMIIIGTVVTLIGVLAMGSTSLRDRYFHVFFLMAPVYVFAELERLGGWQRRVKIYLGLLLALAIGVMAVRIAVTVYPDPRLCGRCVSAEPLAKLRPVVLAQLGSAPTLIAADRMSAGRIRAAVPEARVVIVREFGYRPPTRPSTGCGQVTGVANGFGVYAPARMEGTAIDIFAKWWSPWLKPRRESFWQITPLPADSELCR
jgi:4-amino-4-deoxy-L-arabinose transferase-like glycosyltransferase